MRQLLTAKQKLRKLEEYSPQIQKLEKKKCILGLDLDDNTGLGGLIFFIENFVYIKDPNPTSKEGEIPFILYDFQRNVLDDFLNYRYNIILKSRQIGCSTLIAAYITWFSLFFSNKEILIVANKENTATKLLGRVAYAISRLPSWMIPINPNNDKHEPRVKQVHTIEFYNDSVIKAIASTEDAGRSDTLSLLVIDEAAMIDINSEGKAEKIWVAAEPTIEQSKGRAIVLSRPMGARGFFFSLWQKSKSGFSAFNPIELGWELMPERDDNWAKQKIISGGGDNKAIENFKQEYACHFVIGSTNPVVDVDVLKYYQENYICDPIEKLNFDKGLWIWVPPQENHQYLIGADIAGGSSDGDYSAFHILDIDTLEVVAEYQGRVTTDKFSEIYIKTAVTYNYAFATFENNAGWSETLLSMLKGHRYPNIYHEPKPIKKNAASTSILDQAQKAGFSTTGKVRTMIIDELTNSMRKDIDVCEMGGRRREIIWHSERLYNEWLTFHYDPNGKPIAMNGFHDDLILALSVAYHCRWHVNQMNNLWKSGTSSVYIGKPRKKGDEITSMIDNDYSMPISTVKPDIKHRTNPFTQKIANIQFDNQWLIGEETRKTMEEQDKELNDMNFYEEL